MQWLASGRNVARFVTAIGVLVVALTIVGLLTGNDTGMMGLLGFLLIVMGIRVPEGDDEEGSRPGS